MDLKAVFVATLGQEFIISATLNFTGSCPICLWNFRAQCKPCTSPLKRLVIVFFPKCRTK